MRLRQCNELQYSLTPYGQQRVIERINATKKLARAFAYTYHLCFDEIEAQALLYSVEIIALHNPNRCPNDHYMSRRLWLDLLSWYRSKYNMMRFNEKCLNSFFDTSSKYDFFKNVEVLDLINQVQEKNQSILLAFIKGKTKADIVRETGRSKISIQQSIKQSLEEIRAIL